MLARIRDLQAKLGESRQDRDGWTVYNMVNFLKIRHNHNWPQLSGLRGLSILSTYQRPSRGGGNPGDIRKHMAQDLSTLFVDFEPGMGGLDCFCTFKVGSLGKDLRDL